MAQSAFPYLVKTQGCIVNISSINAWKVNSKNHLYDALKAALNHLTKGLALEFRDHGVRVNALMPGGIHTPLVEQWLEKFLGRPATEADTNLPHMAAPETIAQGVLALASDELRWINGAQIFTTDDGSDLDYRPIDHATSIVIVGAGCESIQAREVAADLHSLNPAIEYITVSDDQSEESAILSFTPGDQYPSGTVLTPVVNVASSSDFHARFLDDFDVKDTNDNSAIAEKVMSVFQRNRTFSEYTRTFGPLRVGEVEGQLPEITGIQNLIAIVPLNYAFQNLAEDISKNSESVLPINYFGMMDAYRLNTINADAAQ